MKMEDIHWYRLSKLEKISWCLGESQPYRVYGGEPCYLYPQSKVVIATIAKDGSIQGYDNLEREQQRTGATAILLPGILLCEFYPPIEVPFQLYGPNPFGVK